uniref:Uncharacterized protein n=1 Tax=Tetradesmus obliquus TaxID=3088 RepID=A0A383VQH4_TETOB|eukprot:jgi/Sobl393_1/11584/SZX67002.1
MLQYNSSVYCFGLADYLGAEWATSRWRVAGTFYGHLTVFLLAHLVLIEYLGSWLAVAAAYVVGVGVASVQWLGIIRDHVIDDSAYRRDNMGKVAEQLQRLEQMQAVLGKGAGGHQATALAAEANSLSTVFQGLLAEMRMREVCIRERFESTEL